MLSWRERYLKRFYDPERGFVDGTTEFHRLCADLIPPGSTILEVGAGPSNRTSEFLAGIGPVHGADPDPAVEGNTALTSAKVLPRDGTIPYPDGHFDACVSNFVIEHVSDPLVHLREIRRVMRQGAPYVFRTPNRYHYVALVAAATPHSLHVRVANRLRNLPEDAHEPYPTVYAMNTRRSIRRYAASTGFVVEHLRVIEKEPSYGMASRMLFWPFLAYERVVNSTERLADLRSAILGVLRNPETR